MKLKKVYIEITNLCNLSCSFCAQSCRAKRTMSVEEFSHILQKIKRYTDYIYLHVLGEPLCHPQLGRLLELCSAQEFKVSLTTNSTLLNIKQKELLDKPCLKQINYSLHSLNEFEEGKHIQSIMNDVFLYIDKTPGTYHNLRLWNLGSETNSDILRLIEMKYGVALTGEAKQFLRDRVHLHLSSRFDWPDGTTERFTQGRCLALRHDFAILSDGTVVPCCLDYDGSLALGNVFEDDLDELLHSAQAKNLIDGFAKNDVRERFCQSCGFASAKFAE